jgi:hypothetical protein
MLTKVAMFVMGCYMQDPDPKVHIGRVFNRYAIDQVIFSI